MKRITSYILAALLLFGTAPALNAAASGTDGAINIETPLNAYTPEELLQQWTELGALLHADGAYPFAELEKGDTGYEVTALQTRLKELGYYQKEIVDTFGNGTYGAMRDFEKASGLPVNGVASVTDQQALFVDTASGGDMFAAYTPQELLPYWVQVGDWLRADGTYPFVELQKGNIGYEVTMLQTRLKELNYYQKEIVDNFGSGTYSAMRDFEKANGLPVNGVASAADQQALFSDTAAAANTQPSRTNSGGGATSGGKNDAISGATP